MFVKQCPACGSEYSTRLESCLDCASPLGPPVLDTDVTPVGPRQAPPISADDGLVALDLDAFTESNWVELERLIVAGPTDFRRDGATLLVDASDEAVALEAVGAIQDRLESTPPSEARTESRIGRPVGTVARLIAGYVDMLVIFLALAPFMVISAGFAVLTSVHALGLAAMVVLEWRCGATVGKRLLGMKVVSEEMQPLTLRSALIRRTWILPQWLVWPPVAIVVGPVAALITIVSIASHTDKRGWHDRLAATRVVRAR